MSDDEIFAELTRLMNQLASNGRYSILRLELGKEPGDDYPEIWWDEKEGWYIGWATS